MCHCNTVASYVDFFTDIAHIKKSPVHRQTIACTGLFPLYFILISKTKTTILYLKSLTLLIDYDDGNGA